MPGTGWKTFHSNRKNVVRFYLPDMSHRLTQPSVTPFRPWIVNNFWMLTKLGFFNLEATLLNVFDGCGDRWSQIISASFGCQQHQLLNSQEQSVILCPTLSNWVCLYHLSRLSAWIRSSSLFFQVRWDSSYSPHWVWAPRAPWAPLADLLEELDLAVDNKRFSFSFS